MYWDVYLEDATLAPGAQLDFHPGSTIDGEPIPPLFTGQKLNLIHRNNSRNGGQVIQADTTDAEIELARCDIASSAPVKGIRRRRCVG
jgi:hypothetical protein